MKFEIINPSDEAYIEADDFEQAVYATMLLGDGYAIKQVDGDLEMPIPLFSDFGSWFLKQFNKPFDESGKGINKKEVAKILESMHLAGERSSLNDFTKYAHNLAKTMLS